MNRLNTVILIVMLIIIITVPLLYKQEFTGSDDRAEGAIKEINPAYKPWFKNLWNPGGEMESLFFTLQASLGAGILGYCIGFMKGANQKKCL